jgi:hypothetical protein
MSLLELTVVILVLLSLMTLLMIGTSTWKRGADRSACILNIRNTQNAVRAYQNVRDVPEGTSIHLASQVMGPGGFLEIIPECPGGGIYTHIDHIPYAGELAINCSLAAGQAHVPISHSDW